MLKVVMVAPSVSPACWLWFLKTPRNWLQDYIQDPKKLGCKALLIGIKLYDQGSKLKSRRKSCRTTGIRCRVCSGIVPNDLPSFKRSLCENCKPVAPLMPNLAHNFSERACFQGP